MSSQTTPRQTNCGQPEAYNRGECSWPKCGCQETVTKKDNRFDVCGCGDYRKDHDERGCKICRNLGHLWDRGKSEHKLEPQDQTYFDNWCEDADMGAK